MCHQPQDGSTAEAPGKGPPLCPVAEEEGPVSGRQGMECPESWLRTLCLKVVLPTATQSWSCSEMSGGRAVPAAAFCPLPGCRKVDTALIHSPTAGEVGSHWRCPWSLSTVVLSLWTRAWGRESLLCEWHWDISSPQLAPSQGTALGGSSWPWRGTRAE